MTRKPSVLLARSSVVICFLAQAAVASAQQVTRISQWPDGSELRLASFHSPLISPNGRVVVFVGPDIWMKDLESGALDRILSFRNQPGAVSFSADGRYLTFVASEEGRSELFLLDLASREVMRLVSPEDMASGVPAAPAVSADLRWFVYRSPRGLVLHERGTNVTTVIPGDPVHDSIASISDDGRRIVLRRLGSRFEPTTVAVFDRTSGIVERVDVGAPTLEGHSVVFNAQISGDGRFVTFDALCFDCGDSIRRLFIRDLDWRRTWELVRGMDGTPPNRGGIDLRAINRDGRFVLFESGSSNLVPDDPGFSDLFVVDRLTRRIVRINGDPRGGSTSFVTSMSADGLRVVFALPPILTRLPAGPISPPGPIYRSSLDSDGDGMPDDWERFVGLSPADPADGIEDSDRDGTSNLDEFRAGSQPRARFQFRTRAANVDPETSRISVRHRNETGALVWLRLVDASGLWSAYSITVPSRSTLVVPLTDVPDRPQGPFMLHLQSDVLIFPGLSQ